MVKKHEKKQTETKILGNGVLSQKHVYPVSLWTSKTIFDVTGSNGIKHRMTGFEAFQLMTPEAKHAFEKGVKTFDTDMYRFCFIPQVQEAPHELN